MAKKESRSGGYEALRAAVKAGVPANLYIFYGEERYLLQTMAQRLKELLIPAGFEEFNYHRLTGKGLTVQELAETAEAMPMMAEHTLITVTDMDIFKLDEGQRTALIDLLSDFPPYCTLIFLYEQLTYKRDGKMKKLCAALNEYVQEVEFVQQERKDLLNWLKRRFAAVGHDIDQTAADHLLFTCGSLMRGLIPEIEKIAAYAKHERITMADIDAVAEPVLDARIFDMTNAVTARNYDHSGGAGQGAAAAVYGASGAGRRQGPRLAEGAVEHEQRLSRQAAAAGGAERGSRLVPSGGEALSGAGPPYEKRAQYG